MRQLYYTLQTLIRGKGSNLIKIVSLGLGLAVSILIFSRQAFELNYDTCYKDHERLCLVKTVWYYNNEYHPSHITLGPVAGTIAENLPDEVESVTVTQQWWSNSAWFANERRFQTNAMTADSCFFATMGIDVVSGDPRELNNPEVVFISRELAGSMFADKNPIGQTVVYNKQMPMTVKGIFEDFPENSSFYGSGVVMSLATSFKHHWGYWGWGGGDILFIVAMNYVLISISAMNRRAKAIGVHKCSGANTGTIFGMFLWETGVIMLSSLLLVALLLFNFREPLEDMLDVSLAGLFSWENIWAPLSVIVILFMIGGMLPGQLFARIPVTQVFRRYTEGKKGWKRPLLFVQFAGTSFIFGLLGLVLMQSHYITNKERGFDYHRVAYASGVSFDSDAESDANRSVMLSLPYVEDGACSGNLLTDGLSGEGVTTDNGQWMSMRWVEFGKDYAPFMKLEFAEGKNMDAPGQILVNETFLKMMHWEDKPIGRQVRNGDRIAGNIVGVLKDFATSNAAYVAVQPMYATYLDRFSGNIQLRLKEPFDDNLKRLNEDMEKLFPTRDIVFSSFHKVIDDQNSTVTDFRNAALLAAITILFVTLMGLIGYINDEIQRRSKEIAIRKVNGAEASSILRLFSKDIFWISLPAVFLGGLGAWYIGGVWIEQFVEGVDFGICGFLLIACIVLLLIIGCVVFKAWRIANENPVDSIKSE